MIPQIYGESTSFIPAVMAPFSKVRDGVRNADSAPAAVEETGAGTAVIDHSKGLPA